VVRFKKLCSINNYPRGNNYTRRGINMSKNSYTRRDFLKTLGYGAIALGITFSCSKKPDYKLTREVVQDETGSYELVHNPPEPLYGETGSAAKALEIGDPAGLATDPDGNYIFTEGADENYIFARIRDVSFKNDTIYVADKFEENIRVFDTHGIYQETIGRKGRGPGEFSWIRNIYVDDDGFVYVYERNGSSLHIFNNDHEFLRKHNVKSLVKGLTEIYDIASFDPENFLLHSSFRFLMPDFEIAHDNENEDLFVRLNKDGKWFSFGPIGFPGFEKDIESLKREIPPLGSIDYNIHCSMILSFKNMFLDKENELLYSSTKAFPSRVVVRSSDDGRILRIIEKSIAENGTSFITQEVDREEFSHAPMLPLYQRFNKKDNSVTLFYIREEGIGIFADDANIYNVYRRLSKDEDSLRVQHFMDVFDLKNGTYKQRFPLDMEIGSNFAGMDDEGNMVVFRNNPWPVVEKYQLGGIEK
jgi:hypothetical protein